MPSNRRDFLKAISLGLITPPVLLSGCTHKRFYNPDQDILLGGGSFKQNSKLRHVLAVVNLQQDETQLVDLDFLPHGIIIDPNNKKRLLTFEKDGTNLAEIDLNNHQLKNVIKTDNKKIFNGHGAFSSNGDTLFCSETYLDNRKGVISVRDASSLALIDEISGYGDNPHECRLADNGATLLVANAGSNNSQASISYIDVQSKKLIKQVNPDNENINFKHIAISDDGSLIAASAPKNTFEKTQTSNVSIRSGDTSILTMTQPEAIINQMTGEALSIAIDNKLKIAAITHPEANMVTFWSIDKKELLKAMSVPNPRGIALSLDNKTFIISYDINTSMIRVNKKDLTARKESIMQPTYASGEHIYNWSKTLRKIMPTDVYT